MIATSTQDYTSVSWTTGAPEDGAVLHVKRQRWTTDEAIARRHLFIGVRWRDAETDEFIAYDDAAARILEGDEGTMIAEYGFLVSMDADGRKFATYDEARAFALERGYLQLFFTSPDIRARRKAHGARPIPSCR